MKSTTKSAIKAIIATIAIILISTFVVCVAVGYEWAVYTAVIILLIAILFLIWYTAYKAFEEL